jgi:hypothetical protein
MVNLSAEDGGDELAQSDGLRELYLLLEDNAYVCVCVCVSSAGKRGRRAE